jgi:signal transduction histidine kinase
MLFVLMGLLAIGPGRALSRGVGGAMPRSALLAASVAAWSAIAVAAFFGGVWLEVVPVLGFLASCYLAGLVVERTDLLESRNQLLARYASDLSGEAQRQRARIEGELHDGIQQLLIVMGREIRQVQRAVGDGPAAARAEVLSSLAEQAQNEIKRLRSDLLPPALRYGGLLDALPVLANEKRARSGLEVKLEVVSWEALPREREIELYWLVSEALNNAEKHADARTATIRLERTRDEAVLEVIDDGKGFHPPDLSVAPAGVDHSGLHRMWLRMRGNHGDLRITSAPGAGARLRFSLPAEARRMT